MHGKRYKHASLEFATLLAIIENTR